MGTHKKLTPFDEILR